MKDYAPNPGAYAFKVMEQRQRRHLRPLLPGRGHGRSPTAQPDDGAPAKGQHAAALDGRTRGGAIAHVAPRHTQRLAATDMFVANPRLRP